MHNSLELLSGYIDAMFKDMVPMYSDLRHLERDKSRLIHEVKYHGLEILTVVLPSISKHFDKCLGEGRYVPSGLPFTRFVSRTKQVPVFLQDLFLSIFTPDGVVQENPDVNCILAVRQILKGLTKVEMQCSKRRVSDEVTNFIDIEASLKAPTLKWGEVDLYGDSDNCHRDGLSWDHSSFGAVAPESRDSNVSSISTPDQCAKHEARKFDMLRVLHRTCDTIASSFGDLYDETERSRHKNHRKIIPGHGTGRTSNQTKIDSKFRFFEWPEKLDRIFPFDHYACPDFNLSLSMEEGIARPSGDCESPSKLIAVPKTMKGPRLIASEPNQHQWIQQLFWKQLKSIIRTKPTSGMVKGKKRKSFNPLYNCIDFADQGHNSDLALEASKSGRYATIDLSSASDRFSLHTLERMFRSNKTFLERFNACRTTKVTNEIDDQFDTIVLKKAFSQGSALTFPVQSIGYAMIAIAAVLIQQESIPTSDNIMMASSRIRIYGDDMIVPVECFEIIVHLLEFLQFKVNSDKTFYRGKFRESCGTDAFDGVDVTPSYVKILARRPKNEKMVSALEASNNLHRKGWWNLAAWQASSFKGLLKQIPYTDVRSDIFGLVSFSGASVAHLKMRNSDELHRKEYQVLNLVDTSKLVSHPKATYNLFQWFIEEPRADLKWSSGIRSMPASVMRRGWKPLYDLSTFERMRNKQEWAFL